MEVHKDQAECIYYAGCFNARDNIEQVRFTVLSQTPRL